MVDRLGSAATAVGSCSSLWAVRAIAMKKKQEKIHEKKFWIVCISGNASKDTFCRF